MNSKTAKKLRRITEKYQRAKFADHVRMMQQQPWLDRLYFAWYIVFKRGMK